MAMERAYKVRDEAATQELEVGFHDLIHIKVVGAGMFGQVRGGRVRATALSSAGSLR